MAEFEVIIKDAFCIDSFRRLVSEPRILWTEIGKVNKESLIKFLANRIFDIMEDRIF